MTTKLKELYETRVAGLADMAGNDPVAFVRKYSVREDIEVAGFLAAQFAYGRVESIRQFLAGLFALMGESPARYVLQGDFSTLGGIYYRLHKASDITRLMEVLRRIMRDHGGIGAMIRSRYTGDIRETLWSIREELFGEEEDLLFFFPKRSSSSALKRWNLYLRWMVRKDSIDFGIWDFIEKSRLIVPLDTHMHKIGRCQGWTSQKGQNWKAAWEITESLKRFSPDDPVKYDFLLCHAIGIGSRCPGGKSVFCSERCMLYEV